jgi:hypothetical protein
VRSERDGLEPRCCRRGTELATLQRQLTQEVSFRELVGQARVAPGPAGRPRARPSRGRAGRLEPGDARGGAARDRPGPAPPGKVYEAWVIASGAPVPAGTFQVDASGKAVLRLPAVDETSRVKTFAVTIEPTAARRPDRVDGAGGGGL